MSYLRFSATRSLFKGVSIQKALTSRHELLKLLPRDKMDIFHPIQILGRGEYGIAFQVQLNDGSFFVIKRVLDDPKIKSRELAILKRLNSRYILSLKGHFYTPGPTPHSRYLNLVTDFYPENLEQYCQPYFQRGIPIPIFYAKLFSFQMFAGLDVLHKFQIVHRDISPKNLFVDSKYGRLIVGDFGNAKQILSTTEKNVTYIIERKYRPPELIYGSEKYGPPIDIWAGGAVLAELLLGKPLFNGSSAVSLLHDMVRILGPPSKEIIDSYGGTLKVSLARHNKTTLDKELANIEPSGIQLLKQIFNWDPSKRIKANEILDSRFYDELFNGTALLPNGERVPVLIRGGVMHFEKLLVQGDDDGVEDKDEVVGYVNQFKL